MHYFYIFDLVKNEEVQVNRHLGKGNLGDYGSKQHDTKYHQQVRPIYLHKANSPRMLTKAKKTSIIRGCVGTIPGGYVFGLPLPMFRGNTTHVPQIRTQVAPAT